MHVYVCMCECMIDLLVFIRAVDVGEKLLRECVVESGFFVFGCGVIVLMNTRMRMMRMRVSE
jgi:hypothetical protein